MISTVYSQVFWYGAVNFRKLCGIAKQNCATKMLSGQKENIDLTIHKHL